MEWLNLVPLPVALGLMLYVQYHERNCSVRDLLKMVMDRQAVIEKKIDKIMEHLMK